MNKLFLVPILSVLLLCGACNKGGVSKEGTPRVARKPVTSLEGTWELRSIYGGMLPQGAGPDVHSGSGNGWKFAGNTYQMFDKGKLVSSGTYSRLRDSSLQTGRMMDALQLAGGSQSLIHFEIVSDTLVLYSGMVAADGTIQKYVPVNNIQ